MKNILVPIDLTDCTQNTLKYAISIGVKSNSKLFFYNANATQKPDVAESALKLIKNVFDELKLIYENYQTAFIFENTPFSNDQIKVLIEKHNIDLVIMCASLEGLKITFFGSHVSELINDVNCPVLSIPHDYHNINIDRIGYATELYNLSGYFGDTDHPIRSY